MTASRGQVGTGVSPACRRRRIVAALGISVLLAGAATAQVATVAMDDTTSAVLAAFHDAKLGDATKLGVIVLDARTGEELLALDADRPMKPASLLKLVTASAALEILGPAHRFETRLGHNGSVDPVSQTLSGDLIVLGGGDPSFGPRFQRDRSDMTKVFRDWAMDLRRLGVRKISGDVIGDDRLFTADAFAPGWSPADRGEWYSAAVSSLTFNDGCIDLEWDASGSPGDPPDFEMHPESPLIQFANNVKIVQEQTSGAAMRFYRGERSGRISARGRIHRGTTLRNYAAVPEPALFTASVFQQVLADEGIEVTGKARAGRGTLEGDGPSTDTLEVAANFSPPLSEFLVPVLRHSQNLYAECVLRAMAIKQGRPASFEGGCETAMNWAVQENLHRNGFVMVDGSGLSALDQLPPRMLANLLVWDLGRPWGEAMRRALARPGEAGSLSKRLLALRGDLEGKTGYIGGVQGLAGYMTDAGGRLLAFAILLNGSEADPDEQADAVDRIAELLHGE